MGWKEGGRFKKEGTYVYLWLIHVDVWQKPTQYCKVIILQLKKRTNSHLCLTDHDLKSAYVFCLKKEAIYTLEIISHYFRGRRRCNQMNYPFFFSLSNVPIF